MKTLVVDERTHQRIKEYCVINKLGIRDFVIEVLNLELDIREHLTEEAFKYGREENS